MIREVNLISYLQEYLKDYQEMQEALKTQQPELQKLWGQLEAMQNNQYILYADTQGIEKFEQMLEIAALDDDTLENRRFRVLSRWNNAIPYTTIVLHEKLETLCGKDGYLLQVLHKECKVVVRVSLKSKKNFQMVEEMLDKTLPANLSLDLSLLYNQHGTLKQYTHRELTAYTYGQLRNEVLKNG